MLNECYVGDCLDGLEAFHAAGYRARTCVTSPPYWGLRDYQHAGQHGLEKTVDEYLDNMVLVFRRVRDCLTDDGTLWLNIGDAYAGARGGGQGKNGQRAGRRVQKMLIDKRPTDCKPKDLIGLPWQLAFRLRADGWHLRSDIIWHKPNPLPESVKDRPTKAHEYIFLLSKSPQYFYDAAAISEPAKFPDGPNSPASINSEYGQGFTRRASSGNVERKPATARGCPQDRVAGSVPWEGDRANKRTVWTVSTKPYPGAHFAVFPSELIEPCILAGSQPGDIVLDPYMGSGTTAAAAEHLARGWFGCEINPQYLELQRQRLEQRALPLE